MGSRREISVSFALALALVLLVLPGAAAAKPGYFTLPASRIAAVHFEGTNGYAIQLQVSGSRERRSYLSLVAKHGPGIAIYSTRKRVRLGPDGSISARLPGVGRIDLDFEPTSTRSQPNLEGCRGRPSVESHGYFRGRIDFRGRQGFTTADLRSARGSFDQEFGLTCPRHEPRHGGQSRVAAASPPQLVLTAARRIGNVSVSFLADDFGDEPPLGPSSIALGATTAHGVTFAAIVQRAGNRALEVPDLKSLTHAKAEPPAPFTGTAEYELLGPKKSSWTGDLAVELPGFGRVALAGPKFRSSLCRNKHCTGSLPPPKEDFAVSFQVVH